MKTTSFFSIVLLYFFLHVCYAQTIPGWEAPIQVTDLPSNQSVIGAYSDGYGQHVLTAPATGAISISYFLLGNDAEAIFTNPSPPFPISSSFGAIAGYQDRVYSVVYVGNQIKAYYSSNGGQTWVASSQGHPSSGSVENIDAFADARGCHIVWQALGEIYYVLFNPTEGFVNPKHVTEDANITGQYPNVLTTDSRLIVSFVKNQSGGNPIGATREADLSTGTPVWELNIGVGVVIFQGTINQGIAVVGNDLHMLLWQNVVDVDNEHLYAARRTINPPGQWALSSDFGEYPAEAPLEHHNFRRRLTGFGDTVYAGYGAEHGSTTSIDFRFFAGNSWSAPEFTIAQAVAPDYLSRPTVSASRTGQYFFWSKNVDASRWMRRRVGAISGNLTTNHFFTGRNWVSGDTYINSGKTVWLKSNSETNILANKKLIVQNGGRHRVLWNPLDKGVASGLYFARLTTNKQSLITKMLYLK